MIRKNIPKQVKVFIDILSQLNDRDIVVLIERFNNNLSLKELSQRLWISTVALKQQEDRLIKKIQKAFEYIL